MTQEQDVLQKFPRLEQMRAQKEADKLYWDNLNKKDQTEVVGKLEIMPGKSIVVSARHTDKANYDMDFEDTLTPGRNPLAQMNPETQLDDIKNDPMSIWNQVESGKMKGVKFPLGDVQLKGLENAYNRWVRFFATENIPKDMRVEVEASAELRALQTAREVARAAQKAGYNVRKWEDTNTKIAETVGEGYVRSQENLTLQNPKWFTMLFNPVSSNPEYFDLMEAWKKEGVGDGEPMSFYGKDRRGDFDLTGGKLVEDEKYNIPALHRGGDEGWQGREEISADFYSRWLQARDMVLREGGVVWADNFANEDLVQRVKRWFPEFEDKLYSSKEISDKFMEPYLEHVMEEVEESEREGKPVLRILIDHEDGKAEIVKRDTGSHKTANNEGYQVERNVENGVSFRRI